MRLSRALTRPLLMLIPAIMLAACGPSREEELTRQLAEAKAQVAAETEARKQAEQRADAATRDNSNDSDLQNFYAQDGAPDDSANSDDLPPQPDVEEAPPPAAAAPVVNAPVGT